VVEGVIVYVGPDEILVDIGAKTEAIVAPKEVQNMSPEELSALQVGVQVRAYVVTPESRQGDIIVSLAQAELERDWETAKQLFADGEVIEAQVTGHNKGGLIVHLGRVRGFLPASQLARERRWNLDDGSSLAHLVGENIWVKIIELDRAQNRLILSERAALRQINKAARERLLAELQEGDVVTGRVVSLADFGAFVDIGGADGLIHLSEMAWHRVNHPDEVVQVGDQVEVYVLKVDRERQRIGLSLKRLQPEPWSVIDERYSVDQLVEVTITRLAKFGAFARLDEDFEGLIHISELADRPINHPREVVSEGDRVVARIIRIDKERRRIGLSLKQVVEGETPEAVTEPADEPEDGLGEFSEES
jgi:small subunit ribosomal protein S1